MNKNSIDAYKIIPLLLLILSAATAHAQSPGFRDHSLITAFPDSEIIEMSFEEDTNYRIVLGGLSRSGGAVIPDDSRRVRGDLTRINYEISLEFSGDEVYEFYNEMISGEAYSELFRCSGRACGSSNYWANDIFKNRILYGPERNQHFVAFSVQTENELEVLASLYIITRGNRRVYAYFEIIEEGGSANPPTIIDTQELAESLAQRGSIIIPNISFDAADRLNPDSELATLVSLFASNPELRVYLVAHLQGEQGLESLLGRSRNRAASLRRALISAGIDPSRVDAQGIGPLSPLSALCEGDDCAERVEMVLQ
jgi:hypothetical protein